LKVEEEDLRDATGGVKTNGSRCKEGGKGKGQQTVVKNVRVGNTNKQRKQRVCRVWGGTVDEETGAKKGAKM